MKKWLPLIIAAGVSMGLGGYWWYSRPYSPAQLLQCLPPDQSSLHFYLDVAMLRDAGILDKLAGPKTAEDTDYRKFLDATGFDYRTDLNAVAGSLHSGDEYFAVRGRFHFDKLFDYARAQGGSCKDQICSMPATQPGKTISFAPIRNDVLALTVTKDPRAVYQILPGDWKVRPQIPAAALWISAPPSVFSDPDALPSVARSFLAPLATAQETSFVLGPTADRKNFELRMESKFPAPEDAAKSATQFANSTNLLKKMLDSDKTKPTSADLSGVLVAGRFEAQQSQLTGRWPIDQSLLEALASGKE